MDISAFFAAIGAGITYGLTSFAKKEGQPFEWFKFGTTLIISAIGGVFSFFMNIPMEQAYVMALAYVPIVENGLKILWRKLLH